MKETMEESKRSAHLAALGIDVYTPRSATVEAPTVMPPSSTAAVSAAATPVSVVPLERWDTLQKRVASCVACGLHATRTQTVFGVGNRQATWMVIGEAPGADEDAQGEPFVGRAGKLLNEMLRAAGLPREQVYIANILKCHPPNNRDPLPAEVEQCEPFLKEQVALVQPKIILAVGRIAAQNLLKTDTPIGKLRGRRFEYGDGIPLVVTYHPAYLLRSPTEKRKAWDDLRFAKSVLRDQL